jgi:hypothetical protein
MDRQPVTITDIDIPFWSVVWFMVKLAIATIPAGVIVFFIYALAWGMLRDLLQW